MLFYCNDFIILKALSYHCCSLKIKISKAVLPISLWIDLKSANSEFKPRYTLRWDLFSWIFSALLENHGRWDLVCVIGPVKPSGFLVSKKRKGSNSHNMMIKKNRNLFIGLLFNRLINNYLFDDQFSWFTCPSPRQLVSLETKPFVNRPFSNYPLPLFESES